MPHEQDPLIINGITFRDWNYAFSRLLAESLGLAPPWARSRDCWRDGYTPAQALALWKEDQGEQKIA